MSVTQTLFTLGLGLMAPILWAALGELLMEQSGVVNIGVEGVMLVGAFSAGAGYHYLGDLPSALLVGAASGIVCGLILALLYVRLGTDQIITGILFNVLALGLTTALYTEFLGGGVTRTISNARIPLLSEIPFIGSVLFDQNPLVYASIVAAVALYFVLRRTWFGLYCRAAAEHPTAVESSGLDVWRLRSAAVVLGCMLAAIGGASIVVTTSGSFVPGLTEGRGFIAIAVVVVARWNPLLAILGATLFGVAQSVQFVTERLGPLADIPSDLVLTLPYVLTIVAVALGRSRYPAACGIPYRRARRRRSPALRRKLVAAKVS